MNEIIYLEPDEDITGVIARVKAIPAQGVSLVIPRGGTIAQSIVNLKLLKREIEKMGKEISLVTKDKISKNLASQVGMTVYQSVAEAKDARLAEPQVQNEKKFSEQPEGFSTSGIKINRYSRQTESDETPVRENDARDKATMETPVEKIDGNIEDFDYETPAQSKTELERVAMATAEPVERPERNLEKSEAPEMAKAHVSKRRKPFLLLIAIFLLLVIVAAVILLPSAEAKVTLATTDVNSKNLIIADKSVTEADLDKLILPAKEYSIDESSQKQYNATGTKDVGTKASGDVIFYNDFDPVNSVAIAKGTVLTSSGKSFVVDNAVSIPPATITSLYPLKTTPGQVKGRLVASENGDAYNLPASKFLVSSFSGVKQDKVYAQSTAAFSGGTTKNVKIVQQSDIDNGKKSLNDELMTSAKNDLGKKGEVDTLKLIASSIAEQDNEFTPSSKAGDQVDSFTIKFSIKVTELAYSEDALKDLVYKKVESGLQSDEMLVNPQGSDFKYDITAADSEKGTASFSAQFDGKAGKKISSSQIIDLLAKSKYGNAESKITAIPGVKSAQISVKPNFWPLMPLLKQRIKVSFDYQKD